MNLNTLASALQKEGGIALEGVGGSQQVAQGAGSGGMSSKERFLRSFCRHCNSQPFFCGELLEICYFLGSRHRTMAL